MVDDAIDKVLRTTKIYERTHNEISKEQARQETSDEPVLTFAEIIDRAWRTYKKRPIEPFDETLLKLHVRKDLHPVVIAFCWFLENSDDEEHVLLLIRYFTLRYGEMVKKMPLKKRPDRNMLTPAGGRS